MPKPLTVWITINCGKFWNFWKILKEMGIPHHLTCLLRNLYAGQEATVRTLHGTTDWFQIGNGVCQGCILSPCGFSLYEEYIMRNVRLDEAQAGIRFLGEISITSDMKMTPPIWQKWRRNKESLDESERGEWKSWLKTEHSEKWDHGIRSHHFMANRWETVTDFILGGSKSTADGDCSHEIRRCLLLARKAMSNLAY